MKTRKIAFILTFPRYNTWNGKTTANDNIHCITRTISLDTAERLLKEGTFDYSWDDGWSAQIECRSCNEARREIQKSSGFMGYEWMINSIIECGSIKTPEETKKIQEDKVNKAREYECETNLDYLEKLQSEMLDDCRYYNDCSQCPHAKPDSINCEMNLVTRRITQIERERKG